MKNQSSDSNSSEKLVEHQNGDDKMSTWEMDDEEILKELYEWVDEVPLSRPKRNINRDFSDGVMVAELLHHYFPNAVDVHNYTPANSRKQKMENWYLLGRKVFNKLDFVVENELIRSIVDCKPGVIERVLLMLRQKIDTRIYELEHRNRSSSPVSEEPEVDQHQQKKVKPKKKAVHPETSPRSKNTRSNLGLASKAEKPTGNPVKKAAVQQVKLPIGGADDFVPRLMYEEKEQECLSREETIQILMAKINRLEHLCYLKDKQLEDLKTKLDDNDRMFRPTGKKPGHGKGVKAGR